MIKFRFISSLGIILILTISSCNLARGTPPDDSGAQPTGDSDAAQQTNIALAVQQTQTAAAPVMPEFTFTPSLTSTITLTSTPEVPMVTVSMETNCRTGPGQPYDILGVLMPGIPAEVVGRNQFGDTWIIKLPSNPSITCWLWGQYATVVGNTSGLTVYTPPPTPTPAASYQVSYLGKLTCCDYYFRFEIKNTGSITWRSVRLVITDITTSVTRTFTSDTFSDFSGCALINTLLDLEPGEEGAMVHMMPVGFNYDPTGHNFQAEFTLFENDGLSGYSKTKSITFIP